MKLNPLVVMKEEFDGTGIVFNTANNKVMTLNKSGVMLWNVLASGADEAAAAEKLVARFDGVTPEQALLDVQAFVHGLRERDLLED